jgi:hypothetical protein
MAHEDVTLGVRGAHAEAVEPLAPAVAADAAGRAVFRNVRLRPEPMARVYVARGAISEREVTRPIP